MSILKSNQILRFKPEKITYIKNQDNLINENILSEIKFKKD